MICKSGHEHDTLADTSECDRRTTVKAMIAETKAALRAHVVRHDHHSGDENCPACKTLRTESEATF